MRPVTTGCGQGSGPAAASAWGNPGCGSGQAPGLSRGRADGSVSRPSRQGYGGTSRTVVGPGASAGAMGTRSRGGGVTTVSRLQREGRQRVVRVQAQDDLGAAPRLLRTEALPWESGRVLATGRERWTAAILHACSQQGTGLEAAQGRKEEAVQRHLRLRCVAQALVQRAPTAGVETASLAVAKGEPPWGQRCRAITRAVLHGLRQVVAQL
jgi:hypothetical protein